MYERFSEVYDALTDDIDHGAWAAYQLELMAAAGVRPKTVCDVGCGTGGSSLALKALGLDVTGVDLSERMLMRAAEKARAAGVQIPFIRQDMCDLSLHRPVDALFSMVDGVNYLVTPRRVRAFFAAAHAQLKPGGALIFDVSSEYKLKNMDGALFFEEREDISYFWKNAYAAASKTLTMELTFFVRGGDGRYERFVERQSQRAHPYAEMEELLLLSGFSDVRAYGDRTGAPPRPDEARIFVLAIRDR
jgi:cyclopropane fatty-acyl-phospholipid synthase-like methyltransferase